MLPVYSLSQLLLIASMRTPPHLGGDLKAVNQRLASEGYAVVDRQESVTGYISVLENVKDSFRALRCDHSLLGGEWLNYPTGNAPRLKEPIYAIFVTLEAVRLAQPVGQDQLGDKSAEEALFM